MQSPYKKVTVFDLETGGFNELDNPITEIAIVTIDLEHLEIEDEWSVMFEPRLDLGNMEDDALKEAKRLFKSLSIKEVDSTIKTLLYKGVELTIKTLDTLVDDVKLMQSWILERESSILTKEDMIKLESTSLSSIANVYFNFCYHPQALRVTHMTKEMLLEEGLPHEEAFQLIKEKYEEMCVGNSKPISAGHNIKKFDNRFMVKLFEDNGFQYEKFINSTQMIDTLEWARLRWWEMSSFSLGNCANKVGITLKESHRALPDTIANAHFLIKLLENLRGEGLEEVEYVRRKYNFNF